MLLSDARGVMDMRDDNGPVTVELPLGLMRRALLEVGRRLAASGACRRPSTPCCSNPRKLAIRSSPVPSSSEQAAGSRRRAAGDGCRLASRRSRTGRAGAADRRTARATGGDGGVGADSTRASGDDGGRRRTPARRSAHGRRHRQRAAHRDSTHSGLGRRGDREARARRCARRPGDVARLQRGPGDRRCGRDQPRRGVVPRRRAGA